MTKGKEKEKVKKNSISMHGIRKPFQRILPWVEPKGVPSLGFMIDIDAPDSSNIDAPGSSSKNWYEMKDEDEEMTEDTYDMHLIIMI